MIKFKNFLIKREQSQTRLSFAECEKSRLIAKLTLTLVALLSMTMGAWAQNSDEVTVTPVTGQTNKWTFTMPAFNVELTPIYAPEFTAAFKAGNDLTIQSGKATVTVTESGATTGTQVTLDENGNYKPLYEGQTITMTAAAGYKFRKVEVKKGGALLSFEIGGHVTATIYYVEGETWEQAIQNHPEENSAWKINQGYISGNGVNLFAGDNFVIVNPNSTIDPNAGYHLLWT